MAKLSDISMFMEVEAMSPETLESLSHLGSQFSLLQKSWGSTPWDSAQCDVAAWMGREFGREWIYVYVRLSPFTVRLKLSQHCQSAMLQYKIKSSKEKKKLSCIQESQVPFCSKMLLILETKKDLSLSHAPCFAPP